MGYADVAELVDALVSGTSRSNPVEVQVLSSAPKWNFPEIYGALSSNFSKSSILVPIYNHARTYFEEKC